jgi:hypothetical protein
MLKPLEIRDAKNTHPTVRGCPGFYLKCGAARTGLSGSNW